MKHPLFILFALAALVSYAQPKERLDTVYYDRNWKGCSPTFATYYRVMTILTDDNPRKQFRDYFITGEIQGEANYISIDRDDDSKSFNIDNYCFDSRPKFDMFWTSLKGRRLSKVWFTGMLTANQTDFKINYIDPESNTVRSYYPDFLVQKTDGTYLIIEVKGDYMIDNAVVHAKKEYAKQMAAASAMEYIIVPGTQAKNRLLI